MKYTAFTIIAVVLIVAGLGVGAAALLAKIDFNTGSGSVPQYKIECTGRVQVPGALTLGLGRATLEEVECRPAQKCSGWSLSIADGFSREGQIKLYLDGDLKGAQTWKSTFGADQEFTIRSSCSPEPDRIEVMLYDGNKLVDEVEVKV